METCSIVKSKYNVEEQEKKIADLLLKIIRKLDWAKVS